MQSECKLRTFDLHGAAVAPGNRRRRAVGLLAVAAAQPDALAQRDLGPHPACAHIAAIARSARNVMHARVRMPAHTLLN